MSKLKDRKKEKKNDLISRVELCRKTLKEIGVKKPIFVFCLKYPEFIEKEKPSELDQVSNLFYGKITDEDFTKKLETFVELKKIQNK